jgi:hypothetical protein
MKTNIIVKFNDGSKSFVCWYDRCESGLSFGYGSNQEALVFDTENDKELLKEIAGEIVLPNLDDELFPVGLELKRLSPS